MRSNRIAAGAALMDTEMALAVVRPGQPDILAVEPSLAGGLVRGEELSTLLAGREMAAPYGTLLWDKPRRSAHLAALPAGQALLTAMLVRLRQQAEGVHHSFVGLPLGLAIPPALGEAERDGMRRAGAAAGFAEAHLIPEPLLAALPPEAEPLRERCSGAVGWRGERHSLQVSFEADRAVLLGYEIAFNPDGMAEPSAGGLALAGARWAARPRPIELAAELASVLWVGFSAGGGPVLPLARVASLPVVRACRFPATVDRLCCWLGMGHGMRSPAAVGEVEVTHTAHRGERFFHLARLPDGRLECRISTPAGMSVGDALFPLRWP